MDSPRTTSRPRRTTSTGSGSPPSVWTTTPPGSPTWPARWAISLRSVQGLPAVPGLKKVTADASGFVALTPEDMAGTSGPAGGRSCGRRCASVLLSFCGAPRYPMDNWQLQHSRSLAFDEQRHQDIASIGKFDRVVMAMRHIWFDHTKLGNAEAGCSRPDPSLVVLNVSLEG